MAPRDAAGGASGCTWGDAARKPAAPRRAGSFPTATARCQSGPEGAAVSLESGALATAPCHGVREAGWGARAVLALAALAAFLPSLPGWWIAAGYARVPRIVARTVTRLHETAPGAPPLLGAEAVAAAPDGTLFVADWTHRHVLAVRPPAPGRWLPPEGRFVPRVDAAGRLHLLDVDSGQLYRFSPSGRLERRAPVAPPRSAPLLGLAPDGAALVAAKGLLRRFSPGRLEVDPSWGPPPHAVPAPGARGLAVDAAGVRAATSDGSLLVWSNRGELLRREPLLGNAGSLAALPGGRLALADRPTGRVILLDARGRTAGRLVSPTGTAPLRSPADLAVAPDGTLAVAAGETVELLRLPGGGR